jgi:hypothetical protein
VAALDTYLVGANQIWNQSCGPGQNAFRSRSSNSALSVRSPMRSNSSKRKSERAYEVREGWWSLHGALNSQVEFWPEEWSRAERAAEGVITIAGP